jgi:putative transposase
VQIRLLVQYRWRQLTPHERQELVAWRKSRSMPWHSPPHSGSQRGEYHVTAACFEHHPIIGNSLARMETFSVTLVRTLETLANGIHAWCLLPNHYHVLVSAPDLPVLLSGLGKMHGRTSFAWNGEEHCRGRKVWFNAVDRYMRSDAHHWATMNYIHHNPVRHGYVEKWQDWPFSSATEYLRQMGPDRAADLWREYPILDYGKGWDDPGL